MRDLGRLLHPVQTKPHPIIRWLHSPLEGHPGMVLLDDTVFMVSTILGDLEGFDGPQRVGFTFLTLGAKYDVYVSPDGESVCCNCDESGTCRHIRSLRRLDD